MVFFLLDNGEAVGVGQNLVRLSKQYYQRGQVCVYLDQGDTSHTLACFYDAPGVNAEECATAFIKRAVYAIANRGARIVDTVLLAQEVLKKAREEQ